MFPHISHRVAGLTEVGIYRVSGLSSDILELKQAFDKSTTTFKMSRVQHLFNVECSCYFLVLTDSRQAVALLQEYEINVIASLLKNYFRELPEPLVSEQLYAKMVQAINLSDPEGKENFVASQIRLLCKTSKATLQLLLDHLLR